MSRDILQLQAGFGNVSTMGFVTLLAPVDLIQVSSHKVQLKRTQQHVNVSLNILWAWQLGNIIPATSQNGPYQRGSFKRAALCHTCSFTPLTGQILSGR